MKLDDKVSMHFPSYIAETMGEDVTIDNLMVVCSLLGDMEPMFALGLKPAFEVAPCKHGGWHARFRLFDPAVGNEPVNYYQGHADTAWGAITQLVTCIGTQAANGITVANAVDPDGVYAKVAARGATGERELRPDSDPDMIAIRLGPDTNIGKLLFDFFGSK